jgi:hypothetical protein
LLQHYQRLVADGQEEAAAEVADLGMGMLETSAGGSRADSIGALTTMLQMQENFQTVAGDPHGNLAGLRAERERIGQLSSQLGKIFSRGMLVGQPLLDDYAERLHDLGEVRAAEWLVEQVGEVPDADE